MRVVIGVAVAILSAVLVSPLATHLVLQVAPPRCQPIHGPGFHTMVCIINLGPQLVLAALVSLVAGALAFVAAWRWPR